MATKEGKKPVAETKAGEATKPSNMTDEQAQEIQSQADNALEALSGAEGAKVFDVEDRIMNVGAQDQKATSSSLALLQEKMGRVFYSDNKSSVTAGLTKDIADLQGALVKINPKDIQREAKFRIIRIIPFFGSWIVNILKESASRRLTLQEFVDHLEESLQNGERMLKQDNIQLKVMYSDIEKKQKLISGDAYFAEVLMEKLSKLAGEAPDEDKKKNSYNKVLFRLATRAQDLRAMENVHEQFYTSIEMTRDNNDMLVATVQRMLTLGMQVVYVAFAIHAALMRQKDVIEAQKGTKSFVSNMILNNATMIHNHVTEIGDLYKEPVIAMDKLEASIGQLELAIDETNRLKAEGIERARENITKIKQLTERIKEKAGELPPSDVASLEASDTLQLTSGK